MISLFYSCEFSWSICLSCFQEVGKPFLRLFPHFQGIGKPFFAFRRPTMSVFSRFLRFVSRRRVFSAFFGSPRGWKHIFRRFLHFWGLGKPFFAVFHSSEPSESHFFQFSAHPRSRTILSFSFCLRRLSKLKQILTPPLHVLRMIYIHCEACLNPSEVLP